MENRNRHRDLLLMNKARAIDLIRMGLRIGESTREVGFGRAMARALMMPPLGLLLLGSASFQLWLLKGKA
jgi:hypothetical protein